MKPAPWVSYAAAAIVALVLAYFLARAMNDSPQSALDRPEGVSAQPASSIAPVPTLPPRCANASPGVAFPGESIVFGEGASIPGGAAIGFRRGAKGDAAVAIVTTSPLAVKQADLASAYVDAPPPKLALQGTALLAMVLVKTAPTRLMALPGMPTATAALRLARIDGDHATTMAEVPHVSEESLGYDFALDPKGGLIVFEEDDALKRWGEIHATWLDATLHPATTITISPEGTDADSPRVLFLGDDAAAVFWIASKNEPIDAGDTTGTQAEGPGERRAYRWIEMSRMDRDKAPTEVARVTSAKGHIGAFFVARSGDGIDVYARNDDEVRDGAGFGVERIHVDKKGIDPPVTLVAESIGNTVPDFLPPFGLAYIDLADHASLVPFAGGAHIEARAEPALDRAIPFAVVGTTNAGANAAAPSAESATIAAYFEATHDVRIVSCVR